MKTLFYLRNKSHTTQLFTRILQNGCSNKTCEKDAKLDGAVEAYQNKKFQVRDGEHNIIIFPVTFSLGSSN